jgi:hypothetical protein
VALKYVRDVLYSKTTSVSTRAEWRKARGLCPFHARSLDEIGNALGVSIIYQDIALTLRDLVEKPMSRQALGRRGRRRLVEALSPRGECPACAYQNSLEDVYLEVWLDHLLDVAFVDRVRAADPLCLAHFCRALERAPDTQRFEVLREVQVGHWSALIAELGEFIRKADHRYQHETIGKEGSAWLRVLDAIAGSLRL